MIDKAIYARLTQTPAIAALVDARVYDTLSDKQRDYPVIVYDVDEGEDEGSYEGRSHLTAYSVTLLCIGKRIADVTELADVVYDAIDQQSGFWGGVEIDAAFVDRVREDTIAIGEAQTARFHIKEVECTIFVQSN